MALHKDVYIVSYFSGPFTMPTVWLPLDEMYFPDCNGAIERIMKFVVLGILALSILIFLLAPLINHVKDW